MKEKQIIKKVSIGLQAFLYSGAGINHFVHTDGYLAMIPPYIPFKPEVNILVGCIEIVLGLSLLLWSKKRKWVVIGIILFLIAVIPAHIYHIQMDGNIPGSSFIMPLWAACTRLALQFVAMAWAWSVRK
jgi:uncharacterized membrane protein